MHYDVTKIIKTIDELTDLNKHCIAGCYNCLLSYYNQSEHKEIDRRNTNTNTILVSLMNSQLTIKNSTKEQYIRSADLQGDILYNYSINGRWTADEYHRNAKLVIFNKHPGEEAEDYLNERGLQLIVKDKE